jgi:hypothetical protein
MIFKQWKQVLNGEKTQTRRIIKPNELASGSRGGGERWIHAIWIDTKGVHDRRFEQHGFIRSSLVVLESLYRLKWVVAKACFADKTYAVQPGRGKAVGRVRITEIRREWLNDISPEDCLAEGIQKVPNEWGTPWYQCPGLKGEWKSARTAFRALWDSIYKKPGMRWEDNPGVWALTIEVAE